VCIYARARVFVCNCVFVCMHVRGSRPKGPFLYKQERERERERKRERERVRERESERERE
jgi:hypothetical protein